MIFTAWASNDGSVLSEDAASQRCRVTTRNSSQSPEGILNQGESDRQIVPVQMASHLDPAKSTSMSFHPRSARAQSRHSCIRID